MAMKAWDSINQVVVITADGEVDSVQDWCEETAQHVKDLRAMGFEVKVKLFGGQGWSVEQAWERAQAYADNLG